MSRRRLLGPALAAAVCAAVAAGCAGTPGPATSPALETGRFLDTPWGTIRVYSQGRAFDFLRAHRAVTAAYRGAEAELGVPLDELRFEGHRIVVVCSGWTEGGAEFEPRAREFRIEEHREDLLEHEVLHFLAWRLGLPPDCVATVGHPQGTDLRCNRTR